jgi:hypothetical protein
MLGFVKKHRINLIFLFALGYPFLVGYLWYLLHIGVFFQTLTGTYPKSPSAEFYIYFLPAVAALFMLPIRPIPFRVACVMAMTFTYLTFMTWPVMAFKHASYCSIHHLACLPY